MASKIVPGNVDGTYPKAGRDNSSQGFRDNFTSIKNNFTEAQGEINDMQTNKANLNATNNFNGSTIQNAKMKDNSEEIFALPNSNHNSRHYFFIFKLPIRSSR